MKKGVGRPKSDTEGVMVRLPREMIRQLDEVRRNEDDIPTRPEMIRRILADWLDRNPPES
ncbi:ribbon-helix-helix protein, CopG family [Salibaculum halophilum]|uniref:ribbon-helix-helix protein, CopG family n=1 Tax=Salibaculum halophilum TaxID=1914408 RepID=UPI001FE9B1E8|nr:ribbon-helix-helix protein, CopG family [Salibaculum halophilum]